MESLQGFAPFLDFRYWMNPHPVALGSTLVGTIFAFFGWFIIAFIALRIVAHVLRKKDKLKSNVFLRFSKLMSTTGMLGLLALFFSYERLPLLGMRVWFLVTFIVFSVWLLRIAMFLVRDYPVLRNEELEKMKFEKYLPKHK